MIRKLCAGILITILALSTEAQSDEVTYWNGIALDLLRAEATHPPKVPRDLAIMQIAVFDAVNAVDGSWTPIYASFTPPETFSIEAAVASASHRVLIDLYPIHAMELDQFLADRLAGIANGEAKTNGLALGEQSAQAVLAWRANDSWNAPSSYTPTYEPGHWRPTPPAYRPGLVPKWGDMAPFAIPDTSTFLPPSPPALVSDTYGSDWQTTKDLGGKISTHRTADQTQIAEFWNDLPGNTAAPPGKWNLIAGIIADQEGNTLTENARMFALLNIAMADAGIVCWDAKYTYDLWRPEDAIHLADQDGNSATTADPSWEPLWPSPNFPEYTSGHSTFSSAAAETLRLIYGTDDIAFSTPAGWDVLPGVERYYSSFSESAMEAGMSRIYGGIHFPSANIYGQLCGQHIAQYVFQNAMRLVSEPSSMVSMGIGALLSVLHLWRHGLFR